MRDTTSRIALAAAMAVGLGVGLANPAFATVTVTVDVEKDKIIDVNISITKDVSVTVEVTVEQEGDGAAEAQALANVVNQGNVVQLDSMIYDATMVGSVNANTGLTEVNQAVGNMGNQGNLVAVALADTGNAFADAQAEVDQLNDNGGTSRVEFSVFNATIGDPLDPLEGSVNDNLGVTQVNQDAGYMNNQTNAVAVAAGIASDDDDVLVALAEAALGQENVDQIYNATTNTHTATITDSINNNTGITQVNQSAGAFGNQGTVVAVGADAVTQF